MNDDMIIDLGSFDFSMIDDGNSAPKEEHQVEQLPYDDEEEFGFDFDEEDEVEAEEDEDGVELETDLDNLPDDFTLKVGGVEMTKGELASKLNASSEVMEKQEQLNKYFQNFENLDRQMNEAFIASATENDMKLNAIANKLRDPNLLDSERGALYRDKEKLERNRETLNGRVQTYFIQKQARDAEAEMIKLERTNMEMESRYGKRWVEQLGPKLTSYVNDTGIASPELRKALSPALLEVLIKAQQFDELHSNKQAKLKEAVSKKKAPVARSAASNGTAPRRGRLSKEQAYDRLMKSGDMSKVFNMLVD